MNPKISVITISFNNKEGLEKTIKSVVSQSYSDFEYIVIDGDSKDGSKGILEKFANKITYSVSEPDSGIYNAMNKGIKAANGEYLLFLNSGDEFFSEKALEKAFPNLKNADIVYGNLDVQGNGISYIKEYNQPLSFHYFYIESLPHPSSFIKKSAFEKLGNYDEDLKIISDWKWFLEAVIFHNCSYLHISETISRFYLDGISSTNLEKLKLEKEKVLSKYPFHTQDAEEIETLKKKVKNLKEYEYKYYYLKKFRAVKLLNQLGIIKIK